MIEIQKIKGDIKITLEGDEHLSLSFARKSGRNDIFFIAPFGGEN